MFHNLSDPLKEFLDWIAAGISFAALAKLLPFIAATFSIAWTGIRIHDRIKYGPMKEKE